MKKKLMALIEKREAEKTALLEKAEDIEDIKELRSVKEEIKKKTEELKELRAMLKEAETEEGQEQRNEEQAERTKAVNGETPAIVVASAKTPEKRTDDPYATIEYRKAFMEYTKTGVMGKEIRAAATTKTGDVAAIIPTTIMNEVIKELKAYGQIFSRTRKTYLQGGVEYPISKIRPVATWISESGVSEKQKLDLKESVTFSYYGLECRIATSLLAQVVSLELYEKELAELMAEAMIYALDNGVVNGTGTGQMLGITKDSRVPTKNVVTITAAEIAKWDIWKKKVFAKLPISYKAGASFITSSATFEGYIDGMVDTAGQPIGRTNYGITDGPQGRFGGKEVIEVEDNIIKSFEDAASGDVIALLMNLENYAINTNLEMSMVRYFDHDTNEWIDKAILIADGKLLDPSGVIIVKKAGAA